MNSLLLLLFYFAVTFSERLSTYFSSWKILLRLVHNFFQKQENWLLAQSPIPHIIVNTDFNRFAWVRATVTVVFWCYCWVTVSCLVLMVEKQTTVSRQSWVTCFCGIIVHSKIHLEWPHLFWRHEQIKSTAKTYVVTRCFLKSSFLDHDTLTSRTHSWFTWIRLAAYHPVYCCVLCLIWMQRALQWIEYIYVFLIEK